MFCKQIEYTFFFKKSQVRKKKNIWNVQPVGAKKKDTPAFICKKAIK